MGATSPTRGRRLTRRCAGSGRRSAPGGSSASAGRCASAPSRPLEAGVQLAGWVDDDSETHWTPGMPTVSPPLSVWGGLPALPLALSGVLFAAPTHHACSHKSPQVLGYTHF